MYKSRTEVTGDLTTFLVNIGNHGCPDHPVAASAPLALFAGVVFPCATNGSKSLLHRLFFPGPKPKIGIQKNEQQILEDLLGLPKSICISAVSFPFAFCL